MRRTSMQGNVHRNQDDNDANYFYKCGRRIESQTVQSVARTCDGRVQRGALEAQRGALRALANHLHTAAHTADPKP